MTRREVKLSTPALLTSTNISRCVESIRPDADSTLAFNAMPYTPYPGLNISCLIVCSRESGAFTDYSTLREWSNQTPVENSQYASITELWGRLHTFVLFDARKSVLHTLSLSLSNISEMITPTIHLSIFQT